MSYATPAFVHHGDWNETTRKEPSQKWFETIVHEIFDAHKWNTPYSDLYTDDMELLKPDGSTVEGGKEAWAAVAQLYGPFTAQWTQPFCMVVTETDYGWEMIGQAWIFGDLPGEPANGEQKVKDGRGKEWDVGMAGTFRFQYRKVDGAKHGGMLLQMVQIMSDTAPLLMRMTGRGLLKLSDLGL
ncbi:hypothetical protein LTR12_018153 [Friedmanniomyces endolithicus]|nr:hypothetical protein LTR74_018344 [Friedmanniomyces endolithicus]KAK1807501.1 hypothetical protein LTR12_018153 [Friedmanniomyces endolithicus]